MFVPPFSLIEKLLSSKNAQASIIRVLLTETILNSPFDEAAYLQANPDVALAVERGEWADGLAHFAAHGYFEGRAAPLVDFSPDWYLLNYPDVRAAVVSGEMASAEQHYTTTGIFEWRSPSQGAAADVEIWRDAVALQPNNRQTRFIELNPVVREAWLKQTLEPSSVLHPLGTLSPKGDLLLGRNGCVFLIGGNDSPLNQFGRPASEVAGIADDVINLFERRRARLADRGMRYLQIIIPEKLSIMSAEFPANLTVPTTLLSSIEQRAESTALTASYLSCYDLFQTDARAGEIYRPVDTHLAPYGAYRLMQGINRSLGFEMLPELVFDRQRITGADVSDRFYGILDSYAECDDGWAAAPEKIAQSRVTLGHFGKRQSWKCAAAPNALKILVCGNSYVEFAERGQYALAWWLARLFKNYEFVWTAELDWEVVEASSPDVVICQTVERFLHRIPNS